MRAMGSTLTKRLEAVVLVAVLAVGGVIAATTAGGAAKGHPKLQETALSIREHQTSCERGDLRASRGGDSRDVEAGPQDREREAEMSCVGDRGEEVGQFNGRGDREDAAEADGRRDHDHQDEQQQRHQAVGRD